MAYLVFKEAASVDAALAANMSEVHIEAFLYVCWMSTNHTATVTQLSTL